MDSPDLAQRSGFELLRRFAKARAPVERCDLCGLEIGAEHDHLLDPAERRLACACGACAVLFSAQSGTKYKRVPRDVTALDGLAISDAQWEALRLPIDLAFFYHSTPQARVVASYPSPAVRPSPCSSSRPGKSFGRRIPCSWSCSRTCRRSW